MIGVKGKNLLQAAGLLSVMVPMSVVPHQAHGMITIVVSGTVDLNFGSMTESGVGGTMVIGASGARTAGGGVTAIDGSGLESPGLISIAGSTGLAIDLSVTPTAFTVDDGGGGAPMNVNQFNLVTNGGGNAVTVTLAANPSSFPIGARLNVGASQVAGSYSGVYTVSANYQ